jgi:hypothetical protein
VHDIRHAHCDRLARSVPEELLAPANELPAPTSSGGGGIPMRDNRHGLIVYWRELPRGRQIPILSCRPRRPPAEKPEPPLRELPAPTMPVVRRVHRRLRIRALLALAPAEAPEHSKENKRTAERHEQDLPPLEATRMFHRRRRRVDTGDCWEGCGAAGRRGRGNKVRKTHAEAGDDARACLAVRRNARALAELLARARARQAVARSSRGAACTARVAGLASSGCRVEELILGAGWEAAAVDEHWTRCWTAGALIE